MDRVLEHPTVYIAWQRPFVQRKFAPVDRVLRTHSLRRILDVGCGPGTNAARFAGVEYVGVDINEKYLERARSKYPGRFVQANLETADLSSLGTFDAIIVNSFLHHLPDDAVNRLLKQLPSLLDPGGRIHILELVLPAQVCLQRIMARLDRGRFARPLNEWKVLFSVHFEPITVETYDVAGMWAMVYFQGKNRTDAALSRHPAL